MNDSVKRLESKKSGGGQLFFGTMNTVVTDRNNRNNFNCIGYVSEGYDLSPGIEVNKHDGGQVKKTRKVELTGVSYKKDFSFGEAYSWDQFRKALGTGTEIEVPPLVNQVFTHIAVLYGHNLMQLPYHDMDITEISDSKETPTTFSGEEITNNFDVNLLKGTIAAKPGGSVHPDKQGEDFTIVGTWKKPAQEILQVGDCDGGEKEYYSVLYLADKEGRRTQGIFIPKATIVDIKTIANKNGTERVIGVSLEAIQYEGIAWLYEIIDEIAD